MSWWSREFTVPRWVAKVLYFGLMCLPVLGGSIMVWMSVVSPLDGVPYDWFRPVMFLLGAFCIFLGWINYREGVAKGLWGGDDS